jgi:hypothetical protein
MKTHSLAAAAILILTVLPVRGVAQCPFRPDGYFILVQPAPPAFASVAHVALWDYRRERGSESRTGLYTRGGEYFALAHSDIHTGPDGNGLYWDFTTEPVAHISYRFTGQFTSICDFARPEVAPAGEVMLRGQLTRLINGNVATTAEVGFSFSLTMPEPLRASARSLGSATPLAAVRKGLPN